MLTYAYFTVTPKSFIGLGIENQNYEADETFKKTGKNLIKSYGGLTWKNEDSIISRIIIKCKTIHSLYSDFNTG